MKRKIVDYIEVLFWVCPVARIWAGTQNGNSVFRLVSLKRAQPKTGVPPTKRHAQVWFVNRTFAQLFSPKIRKMSRAVFDNFPKLRCEPRFIGSLPDVVLVFFGI